MHNSRSKKSTMSAREHFGSVSLAADRPDLRGGALALAGIGSVLLVAALAGLPSTFGKTAALGAYAVIGGILLAALLARRLRGPFGSANAITLGRAAMIAMLGGFAADPPVADAMVWWVAAGIALTAWLLDGLDGFVARRRGLCTAFGARFDMEVDAAFALVLTAMLWRADRAGLWILALGLLRYAFVLAGLLYAPMRRPLPPRQRRRLICALQGAALCLAIVPALPPAVAAVLCAAALTATAVSFALDTMFLMRSRDAVE